MKLALLIAALVLAILGTLLALGIFTDEQDALDVLACACAALACYFGSLLAPR